MIQELVFHLGDCKTGSTSIQYALANKSWQGEGLSVEYPTVVNHIPLAKSLTKPGEAKFQARRFGFVKRKFGSSTATHGVISAEHFEFTDPVVLRDAIHKHLPEFADRIRLIAYVRPHAERLVSTHSERVKIGVFHQPVQKLHHQLQKGGLLFYAPRFRMWRDVFGDQFTLRLMLRDNLHKGDVVEDFFNYLFEGADYCLKGEIEANRSLSLEDLAMLREVHLRIQHSVPQLTHPPKVLGRNLARLFASHAPGGETKPRLHRALAEDVIRVYQMDAAEMDKEFFKGTPMSAALKNTLFDAGEKPQSLDVKTYSSEQEIGRLHAFTDLLVRLMQADPRFFTWATREPRHRSHQTYPFRLGK